MSDIKKEHDTRRGWLTVHARDKEQGDWRLRDMIGHPIDPCWERGEYIVCHEKLRDKARKGDILFDLVYPNGIIKKPTIIRSAFILESKNKHKKSTKYNGFFFKFPEFFFADGEPIKSKNMRNYEGLSWKEARELLDKILKNPSYTKYNAGEKPVSIKMELWEKMKNIAINKLIEKDFLH